MWLFSRHLFTVELPLQQMCLERPPANYMGTAVIKKSRVEIQDGNYALETECENHAVANISKCHISLESEALL